VGYEVPWKVDRKSVASLGEDVAKVVCERTEIREEGVLSCCGNSSTNQTPEEST